MTEEEKYLEIQNLKWNAWAWDDQELWDAVIKAESEYEQMRVDSAMSIATGLGLSGNKS
jgi:hypothetical protein